MAFILTLSHSECRRRENAAVKKMPISKADKVLSATVPRRKDKCVKLAWESEQASE